MMKSKWRMKIEWSWKLNEIYLAFPFAINYYKHPIAGYTQLTIVFLFLWLRFGFHLKKGEGK